MDTSLTLDYLLIPINNRMIYGTSLGDSFPLLSGNFKGKNCQNTSEGIKLWFWEQQAIHTDTWEDTNCSWKQLSTPNEDAWGLYTTYSTNFTCAETLENTILIFFLFLVFSMSFSYMTSKKCFSKSFVQFMKAFTVC